MCNHVEHESDIIYLKYLASIRLKELADKEADIDKKMALRKVFRSLQGVRLGIHALSSAPV